jgi:hypothetical protein
MGGWYVAKMRCGVCAKSYLAVFPNDADADELECPYCEAFDSEAIKYYTPGRSDEIEELSGDPEIEFHVMYVDRVKKQQVFIPDGL